MKLKPWRRKACSTYAAFLASCLFLIFLTSQTTLAQSPSYAVYLAYTPSGDAFNSCSVLEGGPSGSDTAYLVFFSTYEYYYQSQTVYYTISGTATTANYSSSTSLASGAITIPANASETVVTIKGLLGNQPQPPETLTVTLTAQNPSIYAGYGTATLQLLQHDTAIVTVTAPDNSAFNYTVSNSDNNFTLGTSGEFTITRTGGLEFNLSLPLSISGTGVPGVDYTALPTNITLAAGVSSTNLSVNPTTNAVPYSKTVVLGLVTNGTYLPGLTTQAVVNLLPQSALSNSVASPTGRYWRGSGSDPDYWSIVVPLDSEVGTPYANLFGSTAQLEGISGWASTSYHYNATNTLSQTNIANRIAFNNPIVAFGERVGGTPLYFGQSYSFGVYAGDLDGEQPVQILVFARSNYVSSALPVGVINLWPPDPSENASWSEFVSNGFSVTTNAFGLTTTLSSTPTMSWGAVADGHAQSGAYMLTHTATSEATNYVYVVEDQGYFDLTTASISIGGNNPVAINGAGNLAPSQLYSLEFETRPPWRSIFIDQPHFAGVPLPPFYAGKTLGEMLTNTPPVTNTVNFAPSAATSLDNSPELRRSPILDQFVSDMGNDPIALANYVINNIGLTDPMGYNDDGNVSEQCIDPPGVTRSAQAVFLEKQGSPIEECALLVYLLREAGVPAVYEFAPHNGLQMLDARLSQMLKCQIQGSYSEAGQLYTTNTMIPVNYPWVAAYIGTNWVHIFPWLKDYQITEGFNLYDYMPSNYPNAYAWVSDYVSGNSNLMSLAVSGDDTPSVIFPAYLRQTLLQNHPGVSVDDIGVQILNRQHYYSRWQDFPTPTALTNVSLAVESLTSPGITNVDPLMTNIFDTMSVEIYSVNNPTNDIQTGDMRLCDLHDREFYISQTSTNTNSVRLNLVLMPYRTNVTTQAAFSNDTNLLSKEVLSMSLSQYDDPLSVRFRSHRNRTISASYSIDGNNPFLGFSSIREMDVTRPLRLGDQAAICMSYGQVTSDMINVQATAMWQMESAVHANPSLTNTVSPDVYEGETMYLAGLSYYKNVGQFDQVNQQLNKIDTLSLWAVGLSKISAGRNSSGSLTNGTDPVLPNVDMFFYEMATIGNGTVQPNSGQTQETTDQNYNLIAIINGSAEEHHTINVYYQQTNAVSTVKLLQIAQNSGAGIVALNINNYVAEGQAVYQGTALQNWDASTWSSVVTAFQSSYDGNYVTAYITPGPMTNSAYKGMGALILGWSEWQALITPSSLNGAYGSDFQPFTISAVNTPSYSLGNIDEPTISLNPPVTGATVAQSDIPDFNYTSYVNQLLNGTYVLDSSSSILNVAATSQFNLPVSASSDQTAVNVVAFNAANGNPGTPSFWSSLYNKVSDPVDSVTGAFLADETDLKLPGPMPLTLRRNYSSQNLADNQFGTGWKLSILPYLTIAMGGSNIFAADMDGAVLAYVQTNLNTNIFVPTLSANPQLNNETTAGVGGLANRLRDRLVQTGSGSVTNYTLYGADGSIRTFQTMTFANSQLTNSRPYLLQWTDSRGNYYTFTYGTNASENNFGQLARIQSSNGNYLGFYYDIYGHITEAYCGDGRRLEYSYDDYQDLVTVTLPDSTTRSYVYQHESQTVTNGSTYYSTHLIIEEDKPDGRVLQNGYDSQQRVTNQLSTAGADLTPVRTATFIYSNNFVLTNVWTNTISGYTLIVDAYNHTNRFDYTNSLITKITDPLEQTIQQIWYPDNATSPGYPRSIEQSIDKRGLVTQYQYDQNGNVTNAITFGDITGDGITSQSATNTAVYNTNCLPTQMTDPAGNGVAIIYDPVFNFEPQKAIRFAGTIPVSTNYLFYGNATNVVINGSITQTNIAFGLLTRQVRAANSPDASTNDLFYNGNGFVNECIRYSSTTDPNVTNTFYYNERGQMVNQVDALGAVQFFDYDALDRTIEQENFDEFGNALTWSFVYYTDNGEISWTEGPRYNPEDYIYYDYDGEGRQTTKIQWRSQANPAGTGVLSPAGYSLYAQSFFEYDLLGNLTLSVDPRGAMTTNSWDALSRLSQRTHLDTNGVTVLSVEGFGYEPGGQVAYYTNALGGVTTNSYTITGKPESRSNPDGSTNGWRYYVDGRIKRQIQPNGAYWQTSYDDVNRITTRVLYSAAGTPLATNSTELDRRGNVIQRIDEGNNVFTTTFDGLDRAKVNAGPAIVTVASRSSSGPNSPITYVTNLLEQVTTNFYDAAGRIFTNVNALGESTITRMDALGRLTTNLIYSATGALVREHYTAYSADHNSVTETEGSGANAISRTTWTDTEGHTVLSVAYPSANVLDYTLQSYDLAGNLVHSERDNSNLGNISTLSQENFVFDGLNRAAKKVDRDGAVTTYAYDALNDITNRTMPGGLQWQATYNNAGQILQEKTVGGGTSTRTTTYAYFPTGTPFAGFLQSKSDERGVTCTYAYDSWLHDTTNTYTGALPEENLTTTMQFEPRGYVTNYTEQFASTNTGPATSLQRQFSAYGQLATESVNGGLTSYTSSQSWNAAGRRTKLGVGGGSYGFVWQADGSLISATDISGVGDYGYDTAGMLTNRMVGSRSTAITLRDGEGRSENIITTVSGANFLTEAMSWYPDGLLAIHTLARSDFTDSRSYSYANLSRRLIQEQLNLNATAVYTNTLAYDNGVPAGPGVLTSTGEGAVQWSGIPDSFSRITSATNDNISYAAYGHVNGQSTLSAWLDNQPISVTGVGTNTMQWRSIMELSPGVHQLKVAALHPSGLFTAWATNTYTNSIAYQTTGDTYDNAGNITQRVWRNANGTTNRIQTLSWDARGRLHAVTERDSSNSGYNWTAVYDALSRRINTSSVLVTNGVDLNSVPTTISSYFDPAVEFLELGVTTYGTNTEWKLYGPDLNGKYGGLNGTGGFDGVSPNANTFDPVISDLRGNIIGIVTNGVISWNAARPTGYGAVPGYRPVALGNGASIEQSAAWRGHWIDITGYYQIGLRPYDPISGRWLTYDSVWNERDPNYYSFAGGEPIMGFDADGRCVETSLNYGTGVVQGFGQGFFGIPASQPSTISDYYGQLSGRGLAGGLSTWLMNNGNANIGIGSDIMAGSITAEEATLGAATPEAGTAFLGGATVAGTGEAENALGQFGRYNSSNLSPLEPPVNNSGASLDLPPVAEGTLTSPSGNATVEPTQPDFYVSSDGTVTPANGYRAIGGSGVEQAENGNIMSPSGQTYMTFTDISVMTGAEAKDVLQLPFTPSKFASFDTLQIIDDLTIPNGRWNTTSIPEPITSTFPEFGSGGGTQATTTTPINNFNLKSFTK